MQRLAGLPERGERNVAVRVTRDALRQVRGGSPWIYDSSVTSHSHNAAAGDLAVVFDDKRRFAAVGLWDPDSVIRVKVLHAGAPVTVDGAFFAERLTAALARRSMLLADPTTTGIRLVHGENDALPGLVVDAYGDTVVVKLYSAAWIPWLGDVIDALSAALADWDQEVARVVVRLARLVTAGETHGLHDGAVVVGDAPDGPVEFVERGLRLEADVIEGQKTGHFLDQRDNRRRVGERAAGADVLDVFASTGGFALAAAAGGARSVHLVDLAAPAIVTARRNLDRNQNDPTIAACRIEATVGDAFEVLESLAARGQRYDVVVVDPPSFAPRQDAIDRARRAYARLTHLALGVLRPGGTLVQCSCSSRITGADFADIVTAAARTAGRPLRDIEQFAHAADHPIGFEFGAYLDAIFATA